MSNNKTKTIILSTGGTGGHLFPAITLGIELVRRGYDVHLISDLRCKKYISNNLELKNIYFIDFRIKFTSITNIIITLKQFIIASLVSLKIMLKAKPDSIVSFGGYPTLPPVFIAFMLRLPLIIHEQNSIIGKANIFFSKFAKKIALTYQNTINIKSINSEKIVFTGNIVRHNMHNILSKRTFDNQTLRILVVGGSQGAKIFSEIIPLSIQILKQKHKDIHLEITQQVTDEEDIIRLQQIYDNLNIKCSISKFFYNIDTIYENCDLAITRSGSSTIAELVKVGLPAIFIPYPHSAENHQLYNAQNIVNQKAGWLFKQDEISPSILSDKISEIYYNRSLLKKTSKKLTKIQSDGHIILADTVEQII